MPELQRLEPSLRLCSHSAGFGHAVRLQSRGPPSEPPQRFRHHATPAARRSSADSGAARALDASWRRDFAPPHSIADGAQRAGWPDLEPPDHPVWHSADPSDSPNRRRDQDAENRRLADVDWNSLPSGARGTSAASSAGDHGGAAAANTGVAPEVQHHTHYHAASHQQQEESRKRAASDEAPDPPEPPEPPEPTEPPPGALKPNPAASAATDRPLKKRRVMKPDPNRKAPKMWDAEEVKLFQKMVQDEGPGKWESKAQRLGSGRTAKALQHRWMRDQGEGKQIVAHPTKPNKKVTKNAARMYTQRQEQKRLLKEQQQPQPQQQRRQRLPVPVSSSSSEEDFDDDEEAERQQQQQA